MTDKIEVVLRLDEMLARERMTIVQLSKLVGVHVTNLSVMKNGHGKSMKYDLMVRLCLALNCTPNDLFELRPVDSRDRHVETSEDVTKGRVKCSSCHYTLAVFQGLQRPK